MAKERGMSQLQTLRKRRPRQFSSRKKMVFAHQAPQVFGTAIDTTAEVGTGPAADVAPSAGTGSPGKAMLEDVVEVDT